MIRQIRLFSLIFITIIWFMIILPYFLIQTEFGSKQVSNLISRFHDDYQISVQRISHSIAKPYELTLENIIIEDKQQPITYLSAKKLVIGLKSNALLQTKEFDYILVEDGHIELSQNMTDIERMNVEVALLQFKNITIHYLEQENELILHNIYGGIKPWSNTLITDRADSQFNLTMQKITYNRFNIQSVIIQGFQKEKTLKLTNIGGNINQGFFTAKLNIQPDKSLEIDQLKINKLHFQSTVNLLDINELFDDLPKTTISQLSIINSSIHIPNIIIEQGNLDINHLIYDNGFHIQNSDLIFNAQSIIYHDELLEEPLLKWKNSGETTIIEQAIASWNKGNIKITGIFDKQRLTINNIIASGIRYQLPDNWYQTLINLQLPDNVPNITVEQFMLMPSLLIDTNPDFPFQFSAFEAFGNNIQITQANSYLNIDGNILFKADNATLNTIELKKPDLMLKIEPNVKNLTFSALIDRGVIEGNASLLTDNQLQSLTLTAHAIDSHILPMWHLIRNPIQTNTFTLKLTGQLQPLLLNGIFQTNDKSYTITNNQLTYH